MPERPLDLFPNDEIVDKTSIAIEQIFAVHYEKPFPPLFSRFAGEPRQARATRERRGERRGRYVARVSRDGGSLRFSMLA